MGCGEFVLGELPVIAIFLNHTATFAAELRLET